MAEIIEQLRRHTSQGHLYEAMQELLHLAEKADDALPTANHEVREVRRQLIALSARYTDLRNSVNQGTLSAENTKIERSAITVAFVDTLDSLPQYPALHGFLSSYTPPPTIAEPVAQKPPPPRNQPKRPAPAAAAAPKGNAATGKNIGIAAGIIAGIVTLIYLDSLNNQPLTPVDNADAPTETVATPPSRQPDAGRNAGRDDSGRLSLTPLLCGQWQGAMVQATRQLTTAENMELIAANEIVKIVTLTFRANGTASSTYGGQEATGTWFLSEGETQLTLSVGQSVSTFGIAKCTATELHLRPIPDVGGIFIYRSIQ